MVPEGLGPSLDDRSVALVRSWLQDAAGIPLRGPAAQLARVLKDPDGLAFAVGFVDGVVRPEDARVAARNLRALAVGAPRFLAPPLRWLLWLGGLLGRLAPRLVVHVARRVLRAMVGHLVVDATDKELGRAIRRLRTDGVRLNVNLLGEAVLGRAEADRRLAGTARLLARDDVDYVSIKVSASVAPHPVWAFDQTVDDVVARLRSLFAACVAAQPHKFINLDMEEYKDLDLTVAVFTRLLDEPELLDLEAGIALQAYLPDALGAMQELQAWSAARRARGGAPIKVRLVKGANLPMERVEASIRGWPLATWPRKQDTDTHYKQVLDWALTPERIANVRIGVAGHNLFDVARAWLLAGDRTVRHGVDVEMLQGMAPAQAEVVRRTVGSLLLYTPVVHPEEFDVAIAYLVRRLEEGASADNFMSAVVDLASDPGLFAREEGRFRASTAAMPELVAEPHRVAHRYAAVGRPGPGRFVNTPDTDPSVPAHRRWARTILQAAASSAPASGSRVADLDALQAIVERTRAAGPAWGARSGSDRGRVLHAVGDALEAHRGRLIEVMVAETGKTFDQADPEVSEAVDFAHYYAERAVELDQVDGARFVPFALTLVSPPWNFPVAIPAGSTLAALAAGSGVVLKPAPQAERCGALLAEVVQQALVEAGQPAELVALVRIDEQALGRELVGHPSVDQVILTGAFETAELFRSFRPDLRLLAETSGKNAVVVTPSADLDLAVRDIVTSAFGHAGQKCSAASLAILVGSVARSERFHRQLEDALTSLVVGDPTDPATQLGPVIEPASGKLLDGLTTLGPGERWLLPPRRLDDDGRQWTPGLRDGVRRGSPFHLVEYFGPILGLMEAATLDEAIDIVNEVEFGLTSGLQSQDRDEIERWAERVQAGNLYVNRGITGAVVGRQPFGGWKRSAVGPGAKAGGADYLLTLGSWHARPATEGTTPTAAAVGALLDRAGPMLPPDDAASLQRAAASDAQHWRDHFSVASDPAALAAELNVTRYRPYPAPLTVRFVAGPAVELARVLVAAATAGAVVRVSVAPEAALADDIGAALRSSTAVSSLDVEDDAAFVARLPSSEGGRVRLIGAGLGSSGVARRTDLATYAAPVTEAGRIELLPFVREQTVSVTAHRFGMPSRVVDGLFSRELPPR
jgi:RHH-type proline utilization regulon transcriptional repressor/proline dehydrogenase/delta 1-pyrroline-5-carboxylate dehydrogenase